MRAYKRKTQRGTASVESYEAAASDVRAGNLSLRKAANKCSVNFMSLQRYMKKAEKLGSAWLSLTSLAEKLGPRAISVVPEAQPSSPSEAVIVALETVPVVGF